jgi:hypothetical protein
MPDEQANLLQSMPRRIREHARDGAIIRDHDVADDDLLRQFLARHDRIGRRGEPPRVSGDEAQPRDDDEPPTAFHAFLLATTHPDELYPETGQRARRRPQLYAPICARVKTAAEVVDAPTATPLQACQR